jgi:ATP-dependent Clp protease adapter protein ClpS
LKVVDDLSMDEAVSIMQTAHEQGVSVVVTVAQQVRCLSTTNTSE